LGEAHATSTIHGLSLRLSVRLIASSIAKLVLNKRGRLVPLLIGTPARLALHALLLNKLGLGASAKALSGAGEVVRDKIATRGSSFEGVSLSSSDFL
jgi:hypothetical protein